MDRSPLGSSVRGILQAKVRSGLQFLGSSVAVQLLRHV